MTKTSLSRRQLLAAAGMLPLWGSAFARSYPTRPIRLLNPFAAGGSAELTARMFASKLGEVSGANLYVDSVTGAGGTIGSDRVAKARADGYTLLLSNVASQGIAPSLYPKLPYDVLKDFEHIAMLGSFPNVLVVPASAPYQTFAEFVAHAKSPSAVLDFGSAGAGTTTHLTSELFKARTQATAQHVPYRGSGQALIALMSGQLSFMFENLTGALPHITSGRLRALAMTGATRSALLPDVPTMQEAGMSDFVIGSWYGLSAPARTPREICDVFAKATSDALRDAGLQKQMAETGFELPTIEPAGYKDFVAREVARWQAIVKTSGATLD